MLKKSFYALIGTTFLTSTFITTSFARFDPGGNDNSMSMGAQGAYDQGMNDQGMGGDDNSMPMGDQEAYGQSMDNQSMGGYDNSMPLGDQGAYDQGYPDQGMNDQGAYEQEVGQGDNQDMQQLPGPVVNVQIQNQTDDKYQQKVNDQKIQYQVFLQLFENEKDTYGSDAFRQDIDMSSSENQFNATFDNYNKQPGQLLVAVSKKGNQMQQFCQGEGMKDGRTNGVPSNITVTLETPENYSMKNGHIRNYSYPKCKVTYSGNN